MRRRPGLAMGCLPSKGRPEAWASRWRTVEPGGPAGSSRPTSSSSTATSTAKAVTTLVTDAQAKTRSAGPVVASTPEVVTTPAVAVAGHRLTWSRAPRAAVTRGRSRRPPDPNTYHATRAESAGVAGDGRSGGHGVRPDRHAGSPPARSLARIRPGGPPLGLDHGGKLRPHR